MTKLIAIWRSERDLVDALCPTFKGFIRAEIKTFLVLHALSYNGHGPYESRRFSYIDLGRDRWPLKLDFFLDETTGDECHVHGVYLRSADPLPLDLFQLETMVP